MQVSIKPAILLVIGLFAVIAMGLPTNDTNVIQDDSDPYKAMSNLELHNHGVVLLGGDGVLRSFAPNLTILAYARLNEHQIQKLIDDYGRDDNLTALFKGVDGHNVVDGKALTHPEDKDLLPANFPSDFKNGAQPPTSANPAIHNHIARVYAPENCPDASCYGLGNCAEHCNYCIVPYPGFAGHCR